MPGKGSLAPGRQNCEPWVGVFLELMTTHPGHWVRINETQQGHFDLCPQPLAVKCPGSRVRYVPTWITHRGFSVLSTNISSIPYKAVGENTLGLGFKPCRGNGLVCHPEMRTEKICFDYFSRFLWKWRIQKHILTLSDFYRKLGNTIFILSVEFLWERMYPHVPH